MTLFITFILGLICSFGAPPFNYVIPALCSIALFIHILSLAKNGKDSFWLGFSFGYGYFIYSHNWFSVSLLAYGDALLWLYPFGLTLIPAFFALYFAGAGYLIFKYTRNNIFLIAMIWLGMELIRSYGYIELPWLLIGYIWSDVNPVSQSTSLFGIYGLSFLTIIWAGAIREAFFLNKLPVYIAMISFILCYTYGLEHLKVPLIEQSTRVRIIQPNFDQNILSRINNRYDNMLKAISMSQQNNEGIDYIIWPEGVNEYNLSDQLLEAFKVALPKNSILIFNASRFVQEPLQIWNSLFVMDQSGKIIDYYDKIHLVPLGEFIPLRFMLPFINKITPGSIDYSRGLNTKAVKVSQPFFPSICYEATFPDTTHEFFTWIVNITNDGWFGDSIGPKQHLQIARFRSIEQGVPTARAALTGTSAIIDSFGRIVKSAPLLTTATLDFKLPGYVDGFTIYRNYGNYMLSLLILMIAIANSLNIITITKLGNSGKVYLSRFGNWIRI